jgi:hypothetical protein
MDDIDLQLKFSDPAASAAFSADLDAAEFPDFRAATFEAKQNFDAATLIVVLKVLAAPTIKAPITSMIAIEPPRQSVISIQ